MRKFRRKAVFMCLFAMAMMIICPCGVSANTPQLDNGVRIVETAGMNGYYSYDAITEEETFIPAEQYAPLNLGEEKITPQVVGDPSVLDNEYTEFHENGGTSAMAMGEELITPFAIIGTDDRRSVSSATGQYANTCLIVARYPDNAKAYGTGFTLDDYHVLTAGHLAYDPVHGYADHFAVYAGSNAGTYKKYSLAYRWDVGGDYVNNASGSAYESRGMYDDWAILECDTALGVGHLGKIATNSADSMMDYTYDTQGYPFDKNVAEFGPNPNLDNLVQYRMYTTSGRIYGDMYGPTRSARYLDVVAMNLDATQGQSGSPIYRYVSGSGYCAQAMIVAGKDSLQQNYAILINDWLYSVIQGL